MRARNTIAYKVQYHVQLPFRGHEELIHDKLYFMDCFHIECLIRVAPAFMFSILDSLHDLC